MLISGPNLHNLYNRFDTRNQSMCFVCSTCLDIKYCHDWYNKWKIINKLQRELTYLTKLKTVQPLLKFN